MKRPQRKLSPRARRLVMVVGALDAGLRAAALIDLARRPADEVRGSRKAWALALVLVNSLGVVPLAYFARGRQRPWTIR